MTRTSKRKLLQIVVVAATVILYQFFFGRSGVYALSPSFRIASICLIGVLLWLPAFSMRKVFKAKHLNRRGEFQSARILALQAIDELKAQPWRVRVFKLTLEAYSDQPLATAYLCLARAERGLSDWNAAAAAYSRAIELDPFCPTAYVGKAALASELGDIVQAERMLQRAAELGYYRSISDIVFMKGGEVVAKVVGRADRRG